MKKLISIALLLSVALFAVAEEEKKKKRKPRSKERPPASKPREKSSPPKVLDSKPVKGGACWRFGLSRHGVNDTRGVPEKKGEKWRVKVGGTVISSPVFWDGIVYVGSDTGFYALDAETGAEVWKKSIKKGVESSACIADGYVYFCANDGYLYSLAIKTGEQKWKATPKGYYKKPIRYSPGVAYGLVFTRGAGQLSGFDVDTGEEVWGGKLPMPPTAGITITKKHLIGITSAGDRCSLIYIKTGERDFLFGGSSYSRSTPAVANGRVYTSDCCLIGTAPRFPRVSMCTIDISAKRKKQQIVKPDAVNFIESHKDKKDMKNSFSSPTVWDGKVYVGNDSGVVYVFDDKKLKPLWNIDVGSAVRCATSISGRDGILYFTAYDGNLYAHDAKTGDKKWEHKISEPVKTPTHANSCPWVEDGVVYIGTVDGEIVAIH